MDAGNKKTSKLTSKTGSVDLSTNTVKMVKEVKQRVILTESATKMATTSRPKLSYQSRQIEHP